MCVSRGAQSATHTYSLSKQVSATAKNHYEMYIVTFLMLVAGVIWSQVLATMTQVRAALGHLQIITRRPFRDH